MTCTKVGMMRLQKAKIMAPRHDQKRMYILSILFYLFFVERKYVLNFPNLSPGHIRLQ